jgi:hypothetical protein
MNTTILILILGLAALVGIVISFSSIKKIIQIRRTPTCWISALPMEGPVEIVGQTGSKTTRSPITSTECVLWQVEVKEQRSSGKSSHWVTIFKETSTETFDVLDETGKVQVNPSGADLVLIDDVKESSGWLQSLDSQTLTAVERLGIETTGFLGLKKTLQVYERYVSPGENIYVLGEIQGSDGYKAIASAGGSPVIISDRSERELLTTLYGRVALWILVSIAVGGGLIFYLSQAH